MKKEIINIYKPIGLTPLEVINRFKKQKPEYEKISATYAGRLDPLAEGVLVLLFGDSVYEKEKYLGLDKEYEAEILLGIKTDTFDVLGLPKFFEKNSNVSQEQLDEFKGDFEFRLPVYSSFKAKGKPLFWWARKGKIDEIEIPKKKVKIFNIKLLDSYEINSVDLLPLVLEKIDTVKGDFRQEQIKEQWKKLLKDERVFNVVRVNIFCSSGTYIRSIADELGGVILGLKRMRVGEFGVENSTRLH